MLERALQAVTRPDALHVFTAIVLASFMLCMLSSYGLLEYSRRATPHDAGAGDQARLGEVLIPIGAAWQAMRPLTRVLFRIQKRWRCL